MTGKLSEREGEQGWADLCRPQCKSHRLKGRGLCHRVTRSHWAPFLLEKSIWRMFLALINSDSGLDPVTVPASFRRQLSEESRREWEGRISTDRQEDSVSQELRCSQTSALLGRERSEMREQNKIHIFVWILRNKSCLCLVTGHNVQTQRNIGDRHQRLAAFSWLHVLPLQSRLHLQLSRSAKGTADFLKVANAIQAECEPAKSLEAQTWPECFPEEQFFLG